MVGGRVGATCRSMYRLDFEANSSTRALAHAAEAVYYVIAGSGSVIEHVGARSERRPLTAGAMIHVAPQSSYGIESDGDGLVLVGGPSPLDPDLGAGTPEPSVAPGVRTFHRDEPGLLVPFISQDARLVVWLGADAVTANMNYVVLEPGERNKEHVHRYSEDTIHILEGRGTAENVSTGERFDIGPGDTVHIEIGTWHAVEADRGERVVSVGGPCPADIDMLKAAGVDVDALGVDLSRLGVEGEVRAN
jgi:quercetin dioxygenase-like cupin family protein